MFLILRNWENKYHTIKKFKKWKRNVNFLHTKLIKNIFFFLLIFLIIVIIISIGLTIYINHWLTQDKLLSLTERYSQQYLKRDITFHDFKFNPLKGIILNNINIGKNQQLANSVEFFIKE